MVALVNQPRYMLLQKVVIDQAILKKWGGECRKYAGEIQGAHDFLVGQKQTV